MTSYSDLCILSNSPVYNTTVTSLRLCTYLCIHLCRTSQLPAHVTTFTSARHHSNLSTVSHSPLHDITVASVSSYLIHPFMTSQLPVYGITCTSAYHTTVTSVYYVIRLYMTSELLVHITILSCA